MCAHIYIVKSAFDNLLTMKWTLSDRSLPQFAKKIISTIPFMLFANYLKAPKQTNRRGSELITSKHTNRVVLMAVVSGTNFFLVKTIKC